MAGTPAASPTAATVPADKAGWAAPVAHGPVVGKIAVPGSKSATARALVLAALAEAPGAIRGGLTARDTTLMIAALRALGATIDDDDPLHWKVAPIDQPVGGSAIDCGLAGTVARFVPPIAALAEGSTLFDGDPAARRRPVGPLLRGLEQLGSHVTPMATEFLPFSVTGKLTGGRAVIDAGASSQFVSGLLLTAPRFPAGLDLAHKGSAVPSRPHITMTIDALAARGVSVEESDGGTRWQVAPGSIGALDEVIEPDLTTAAVFLAAALVAGGEVTVPGWPAASAQPGLLVPDLLDRFGATSARGPAGLTTRGTGEVSGGGEIDLHEASELTCVVAALAALAEGPTRIRGVAHIRGHETDRLAALREEITALGGRCEETDDGLAISPARLHGGVFRTWGDHRMAHAGALIGLRVPGIVLDDVAVTAKTMPLFPPAWSTLVAGGEG
ncbi:MAG: 3-phosphoshikimate 1-carboxyvinyltransferase [Propionibacteriaceae bacterium]|jgi:3-phosphoshikimate 1-carboxyvinyltransferase|nr:3-phosphoshikimate 1-carboxyvinyltransferase [Propionibacteriaceae bacterium]